MSFVLYFSVSLPLMCLYSVFFLPHLLISVLVCVTRAPPSRDLELEVELLKW